VLGWPLGAPDLAVGCRRGPALAAAAAHCLDGCKSCV